MKRSEILHVINQSQDGHPLQKHLEQESAVVTMLDHFNETLILAIEDAANIEELKEHLEYLSRQCQYACSVIREGYEGALTGEVLD